MKATFAGQPCLSCTMSDALAWAGGDAMVPPLGGLLSEGERLKK